MRSLFPLTYDRADVLMSVGCSIFVSAAGIMILPRAGTVLLELLVGLFLIGCAIVTRCHLRRRVDAEEPSVKDTAGSRRRIRSFDRYDLVLVVTALFTYIFLPAILRRTGLSTGTIHILPLVLLGLGILFKPRVRQFVAQLNTRKDAGKETVNHANERN